MSKDDYTVSAPSDMTIADGTIDGTQVWDVYCTKSQEDIKEFKEKTATTLTRTLTITLNGTGEKITTDVIIDRTAPEIKTVADLTGKFTPANNDVINASYLWGNGGKLSTSWIGDQYGKTVTNNGDGTFTFQTGATATASYNYVCTVPLGEGSGAPSALINNNKKDAAMTVETGFSGATLTIDFGGTTATVKILSI